MKEITTFILNNWKVIFPLGIILFFLPFIFNKVYTNNPIVGGIKQVFQILLTNWVNLVVILISTFIFCIINSVVSANFTFGEAIFGSVFFVLGYGIMFWLGFFILIGILDVILFSIVRQPQYLNYKLTLECIVISLPFIYLFIKYNQWVFLVAVLAFLIGQYLRRPYILRILQ
jgi:hypothetical protein